MKLRKIESGEGFLDRLKFAAIRVRTGERAPDAARLLAYRPEMFGAATVAYFDRLLRGASEWTVGERELIAAYVSKTNECAFCYGMHRAVAERAMGKDIVAAVFDDVDSASIPAPLRATLAFVEKLAQDPTSINGDDVSAALSAGTSRAGLENAIHICAVFCVINRLADAFEFETPSMTGMSRVAKLLLQHGYAV